MNERLQPDFVLADAGVVDPTDDRFRRIVERLPLVVYTHGGGRPPAMTYVSPQIEDLLDAPASHWTEQPHAWITRIDPDDRERVLAALDEACNEGRELSLEYRFRRSDGRAIWVRDDVAPIRDLDGRVTYWLGTIVDITDRRRAEDSLRGIERRSELLIDSVTDHAMLMLEVDGTIVSWNPGAERLFGYTEREALGKNITMLLPDELHDSLREELQRAVREGRAESEGWRIRTGGTRFWGHTVTMPVRDGSDRLLGLARVTRDLTERREAARLLSQRVRQQAAVAELGVRAVGTAAPEPLLDEATYVVARTLDMPFAALLLVEDEQLPLGASALRLAYGFGWRPGLVGSEEVFPEPGGALWHALIAGQPVIVPDPSPQIVRSLPAVVADHSVLSALIVPVRVAGRPAGALLTAADREMSLGESEMYFVQAVANVIGSFLERSRADRELRSIAADRSRLLARLLTTQEEERAHVARELHDELAQTLAGIGLFAASLGASADGDVRETSEQITTMAQDAAHAVRRLIGDLRPMELEDGFAHAVERVAGSAGDRRGMPIAFRLEGEPVRLPDDVEVAGYRIVQEALQNVVKHAPEATATLTVRYTADLLEVDVSDHGPGFEHEGTASDHGDHVGLVGMQERATLIGAHLDIRSTPGRGTIVRMRLPIERSAAVMTA